jgi:cold-inducible RNA-binding protein
MKIAREIFGSDVPSGSRPIIAPRRISAWGEQDNPLSSKLYVGNLSFDSTENDLKDLFGRHGSVESVAVITDRETGRPRGFAFVEMSEASAAQDAIRALDGTDFGGRNIKVNEAQDRRGGGGGGGGGGRGRY